MNKNHALSAAFFLCLVVFGMMMASRLPLWNDELYSLVSSTYTQSYTDILTGKVQEGNNSPLYYFFEKAQCTIFKYHPPAAWINGNWNFRDPFSQWFLRIQPVLCMSLGLAILFYYFLANYSLVAGLYAIAVSFSSMLVLQHWAEARPYALWFSLSLIQMLILLDILKGDKEISKQWTLLTVVNFLLALTGVLSMISIAACAVTLFMQGKRKWQDYVVMAIIPIAICIFYYIKAPKYDFFFVDGPMALVNANIPKDRLFLFLIFAGVFIYRTCLNKDAFFRWGGRFLLFLSVLLGGFSLLLLKLKIGAKADGFQISSRYFLPLTAAGIVATVVFSIQLVQGIQNRIWKTAILILLTGLLAFRLEKTAKLVPFHRLFPPAIEAKV